MDTKGSAEIWSRNIDVVDTHHQQDKEHEQDKCCIIPPSNAIVQPLCETKLRDRNWRPEGGEGEPLKIPLEIDQSAYIPKSPQPLGPRRRENSYGLAISKRKALGSEAEAIQENFTKCSSAESDRSDRLLRPVRPVLLEFENSDRLRPDRSQTKLQMANLEQTKSKSNETWRIASHLPREHIPKRTFPKD